MPRVLFNNVVTEHETLLDAATRLAACCTFYYGDWRDQHITGQGRRDFCGLVEVQLVSSGDAWSLAAPGAPIGIAYTIDGRKNEGVIAREIHKLIGGTSC